MGVPPTGLPSENNRRAKILIFAPGNDEIDGFRRRGSVADEMAIRERVIYVTDHPWLPVNRTGREFIYGVGQLYDVDDESLFEHTERLLDILSAFTATQPVSFSLATTSDQPDDRRRRSLVPSRA